MPEATDVLQQIVSTLPRFSYRLGSEVELHEGIADVLLAHAVEFKREFVAGVKDRFDFLVAPGIVIEAKVQGSLTQALSQVKRYAAREDVNAVILVTTRYWGKYSVTGGLVIHGKPVKVIQLKRSAF